MIYRDGVEWEKGVDIMGMQPNISEMVILLRGGGDIATGTAWRLHRSGFKVLITEIEQPMAVRRTVAFCEAVYDGNTMVEGVEAQLARGTDELVSIWEHGKIPVLVDPEANSKNALKPHVLVDAILAKKNLGTAMTDAPLVIGLGPGFEVGKDVHFVVETNRGHNLGRLLTSGSAEPNTGVPGPVQGLTTERVLRAPANGLWDSRLEIGDMVDPGDEVGSISGKAVTAEIGGVIRGLIRSGIHVREGLKIGDIDPRGRRDFCDTISEKALAISGGVLEGILRYRSS